MIRERVRFASQNEGCQNDFNDTLTTTGSFPYLNSSAAADMEEGDQLSRKSCHRSVTGSIARLRQSQKIMWSLKAGILVLCLHGMSNRLDSSISFPLVEGMQRRLSSKAPNSNSNFRQPRVLQLNEDDDLFYQSVDQLVDDHRQLKESHRGIYVSRQQRKARRNLKNSYQYKKWQRDPLREGDCEPMKPWQETSFPSCNKWHEVHMEQALEVLTEGGYNTIYKMTDIDGTTHIAKILKYKRDYTDRNFDRVRRDSLLMERATSSDYVVNTYSYCGFSQVIEFGRGGNLGEFLFGNYPSVPQDQKLQIATQVTQALADVHNLEGNGISSMTHGDFALKQYIFVDGKFKLSDFNRGRFIRWNNKLQEPCPYTIGHNGDKFRAPEEYIKGAPQTAAIDVWALGSIFAEVVSGVPVWYEYENEVAQKAILEGIRPPFEQRIQNRSDPVNKVLLKAVEMCWVQKAQDRPTAGVVLEYLKQESARLGIQWDQPFKLRGD